MAAVDEEAVRLEALSLHVLDVEVVDDVALDPVLRGALWSTRVLAFDQHRGRRLADADDVQAVVLVAADDHALAVAPGLYLDRCVGTRCVDRRLDRRVPTSV